MKHFSLYFLALAGLALACCTKADEVNPEEQASDAYWYNQIRNEVLYIDKGNSAFILQRVGLTDNEDGTPALAVRNGDAITLPYTLEGNRFVFKEGCLIINGITSLADGYEEAWFDADGNLNVRIAKYYPSGDHYAKDPDPDSTWEKIYTRKALTFIDEN